MFKMILHYKEQIILILFLIVYFYFDVSQYFTFIVSLYIWIAIISYNLYVNIKHKTPKKSILLLSTNNDSENKTGKLIFGSAILLAALGFLFFSDFEITNSFLGIILGVISIINSRYKAKSLCIRISKNTLKYKVGKIKKDYPIKDIEKVIISANEIILSVKKNIAHSIPFLNLEENEIRETKKFFASHLDVNTQIN